jgi:enoyl-CoA hydratase/carnithine racemase
MTDTTTLHDRVTVEVADGIAVVTMVRGAKHNALDPAMFDGLVSAAEQVGDARGVRVVVLRGDGPSFCSGLDFPAWLSRAEDGIGSDLLGDRPEGGSNRAQRVSTDWTDLAVPVIAAVHGNCFGGGLQIALGCDLRICAPDARLSVMEAKWGLIPDMGITRALPKLMRIDQAKELTFTGRVVSGEEAAAAGLATEVAADPQARALEHARAIAERSPDAVRHAKRLYEETWAQNDVAAGLMLESELQTQLLGSPNQLEAVRAAFAKEKPSFTDREAPVGGAA